VKIRKSTPRSGGGNLTEPNQFNPIGRQQRDFFSASFMVHAFRASH